MSIKETVFEILVYLYDHKKNEKGIFADEDQLKNRLSQAGFGEHQVNKAFAWFKELSIQMREGHIAELSANSTIRLFSELEMQRLDSHCRGFLLFLEQRGILDGNDREWVLECAVALGDTLELVQLKWIVLVVLSSHPDKGESYSKWVEAIIMDDMNIVYH